MASVTIDIPGIGPVEAKNAASEETLRAILKALGGKSGGGGSPSAGGGGADKIMGPNSPIGKATKNQSGIFQKMGGAAGKLVGGLAKLGVGAFNLAGTLLKAFNVATNLISGISDLENSVTGAAASIPFVGGALSKVAKASEKLVDAFQSASSSGATFGGSVQGLSKAAAGAGMTIDQYSKFVQTNGEAFRLLGGTVEGGRKRFEDLSKEMRQSGMMSQLNALGFTSEQVNVGMSKYTKILGQTGKLQGMTTTDLANRSAKYMKEIDQLAKATGQERERIEENQAKLLRDAQYQAKAASMGVDAADAFRKTITGLPEGLQGVAKDIMTTGTATTKESQEFMALMPKSAAMMQEYAKITEAGGELTLAQQQALQNTLAEEGAVRKQQYRDQGRMNADLGESYMRIVDSSNIVKDALVKGAKQQEKQIKVNDGAVKQMEAFRRRVNEISIEFTNFLQQSGLMSTLMNAFEFFTNIIRNVAMPVFTALGAILTPIIDVLDYVLTPAFDTLGWILNTLVVPPLQLLGQGISYLIGVFSALKEYLEVKFLQVWYKISDTISDFIQPALDFFGRITKNVGDFMQDVFIPAFKAVGDWFYDVFKEPFQYVADFIDDHITPAFEWLYDNGIKPVADAFRWLNEKMTAFFDSFRSVTDVVDLFKLQFSQLGLAFKKMKLWIDETVDVWETDEDKAEFEKRRQEIAQEQADIDQQRIQLGMRFVENQIESEKERELAEAERLKKREERDKKLRDRELKAINGVWDSVTFNANRTIREGVAAEAKKAAECITKDYSNPIEALKGESKQQKSYLATETAATAIDSMAAKKAEEEKKKAEQEKKEIESKATSGNFNSDLVKHYEQIIKSAEEQNAILKQILREQQRNTDVTGSLGNDLYISV